MQTEPPILASAYPVHLAACRSEWSEPRRGSTASTHMSAHNSRVGALFSGDSSQMGRYTAAPPVAGLELHLRMEALALPDPGGHAPSRAWVAPGSSGGPRNKMEGVHTKKN